MNIFDTLIYTMSCRAGLARLERPPSPVRTELNRDVSLMFRSVAACKSIIFLSSG